MKFQYLGVDFDRCDDSKLCVNCTPSRQRYCDGEFKRKEKRVELKLGLKPITKTFGVSGREYLYIKCPECGVWVEPKNFEYSMTPKHENCDGPEGAKRRDRMTVKLNNIMGRMFK